MSGVWMKRFCRSQGFEGYLLKSQPGILVGNVLTAKNFTPPTNPLMLLLAQNLFSRDFVAKGLATQSVVLGPAASASLGSMLEMQILRSHPRPMNQTPGMVAQCLL